MADETKPAIGGGSGGTAGTGELDATPDINIDVKERQGDETTGLAGG